MMRWTQPLLHRCQADPLKHSASDDDDDDDGDDDDDDADGYEIRNYGS